MRILILVKSVDGGTGTYVHALKKLVEKKNGAAILHVVSLEEPSYRKLPFRVEFIHSHSHYPERYLLHPAHFISLVREVWTLRRVMRTFKPQVVLSVDVHCNILGIVYKVLMDPKVKVVATTHINLHQTLLRKASVPLRSILKLAVRLLYDRADTLVAVSEGVRSDLVRHFHVEKPIKVIYNGVAAVRTKKKKERAGYRILSAGRLVPQKDYATLIHAFAQVHKAIPRATLTIAGDGVMKDDLTALAREMHLQNNVIFQGWKNDIHYVQNADVFVLSSFHEGLPYVLLEAMAAGLPVVSTDTPYGPREILQAGTFGLLVPVGNVKKLAGAMTLLLRSKKSYDHYAAQSLKRAAEFSLERMLAGYRTLLEQVAG